MNPYQINKQLSDFGRAGNTKKWEPLVMTGLAASFVITFFLISFVAIRVPRYFLNSSPDQVSVEEILNATTHGITASIALLFTGFLIVFPCFIWWIKRYVKGVSEGYHSNFRIKLAIIGIFMLLLPSMYIWKTIITKHPFALISAYRCDKTLMDENKIAHCSGLIINEETLLPMDNLKYMDSGSYCVPVLFQEIRVSDSVKGELLLRCPLSIYSKIAMKEDATYLVSYLPNTKIVTDIEGNK